MSKEDHKITMSSGPHIRDPDTVVSIMWWVIAALLPATLAGIYIFGAEAFAIVLISITTAVLTEYCIQRFTGKDVTIEDGSAVLTGLLLALVLPPSVPWWIPVTGSFIAIAIAKHAFGGLGHNIFNPALVGRAFLMASYPVILTTWRLPDGITGATPLAVLKAEGIRQSYSHVFFGMIGGCIGEVSALALLIGGIFLLYKRIISWHIPVYFIISTFVFTTILGQDGLYHVLAGGLMLGAFFMATDYVTSPLTVKGKIYFGVGCGLLTAILRIYSGYPEGVMFSILLMNGATPIIDRHTRPKPFGYYTSARKKPVSGVKEGGSSEK